MPIKLTALAILPIIALFTYTLAHLKVVLPKLYELFVEGTKSPLAVVVPTVVNVPLTVKLPPIDKLPLILAAPVTFNAASGAVLPIPTLLVTESTNRVPLLKFTFVVAVNDPVIEVLPEDNVLPTATAPENVAPALAA